MSRSERLFFLFNERLVERYPSVYGQTGDGGSGLSAEEAFTKQWGWYSPIYAVAGGDLLKFDEVLELELNTFLTFLSFEAQKNEIEISKIKK